MMVADAFEYSLFTIKEEALIRSELYRADTEYGLYLIYESLTLLNLAYQCVKIWRIGCP